MQHMQRLLCLCIFALGTLVGAVPTRRADTHTGVRLSLEPRDDGYVNGLALRKALSAHNAEYARTSKINPRHRIQPDPIINTAPAHSDPEVLRRSSDSLEERSTGQSISRAVAIERRKNYQPWVTLKLTGNTIDRFTDGEYLGEISIKDHTTPFRARFDTTTFNTLVPGRSCESENGCEGSPNSKYDESGISINDQDDQAYREGIYYTGHRALDDISIGSMVLRNAEFIAIDTADDAPVYQGVTESIVSLGLSPKSTLGQLYSHGAFNAPDLKKEMAMFFGRTASGTQLLSTLTLGGNDSTRYTGNIKTLPHFRPANPHYWEVGLSGVFVNSQNPITPGIVGSAIFDTASSLIVADTVSAQAIFAAVDRSFPPQAAPDWPPSAAAMGVEGVQAKSLDFTFYGFPCTSPPQISFNLAGQRFAVDARDISLGQLSDTDFTFMNPPGSNRNYLGEALDGSDPFCVASLAGREIPVPGRTGVQVLLGTPFLKSWYSIYSINSNTPADPPTISLAKAIESADPNDNTRPAPQVGPSVQSGDQGTVGVGKI